jgi:fructosamine-3-kinase
MTSSPDLAWREFHTRRLATFYPKTDTPLPDALLQSLRDRDPAAIDTGPLLEACRPWLGSGDLAIAPLASQGTFHRLFQVENASRARLIARVSSVPEAGVDLGLWVDRWASETARSAGIPSPEIVCVDTSRTRAPFDFLIMREAPGQSLREFDHDDDALRPLLRELGATVARLHATRLEGFGWIDVGRPDREKATPETPRGLFSAWRDYVWLRSAEHLAACVTLGAIQVEEARRIEAVFDRFDGRLGAVEPRLLHGDLGNHNVFVDRGNISALIDWEDCLAGDPCFDIAFWGTFHPERRRPAFLEGYARHATLPDDFEARYWLYYLRIALSKTVHRARFGYADHPGRPPASGRIRLALDRVEALC